MRKITLAFTFLFLSANICFSQEGLFNAKNGIINFKSDAPLEVIKAQSKSLQGLIDPNTKEFAFSVDISSFHGFNSDVQRTHFLEDYLEETKFPKAIFRGKIIEDNLFDKPGTYPVRAKGVLEIHGIEKERIIKGTLTIKPGSAHIETNFLIPLSDHGIEIPKIVKQKIAEEIMVTIDIEFIKGSRS